MKTNLYFFILWIITTIVIIGDVFNFLYAEPYCFNAYPILPFNVYPSYCRGTNRYCTTMEGIFEMAEYSDECGSIEQWIEKSYDLDSLCIYSVLQYAWKRDSLLIEVSLADSSTRWLLASPASSKKYKCKLQEVTVLSDDDFNSYHQITLYTNSPTKRLLDSFVELSWSILYLLLFILIPILNIICLILLVKFIAKFETYNLSLQRKIFYIVFYLFTIIMPTSVWIVVRAITDASIN